MAAPAMAAGDGKDAPIHRPEAFQLDDLQRIGERDLAGQVVVEPPGEAAADDGQRTDQTGQGRLA